MEPDKESTEGAVEEFIPTTAHPVDEDPEECIGVEIPDPWDDPKLDEGWMKKPEDTA